MDHSGKKYAFLLDCTSPLDGFAKNIAVSVLYEVLQMKQMTVWEKLLAWSFPLVSSLS